MEQDRESIPLALFLSFFPTQASRATGISAAVRGILSDGGDQHGVVGSCCEVYSVCSPANDT